MAPKRSQRSMKRLAQQRTAVSGLLFLCAVLVANIARLRFHRQEYGFSNYDDMNDGGTSNSAMQRPPLPSTPAMWTVSIDWEKELSAFTLTDAEVTEMMSTSTGETLVGDTLTMEEKGVKMSTVDKAWVILRREHFKRESNLTENQRRDDHCRYASERASERLRPLRRRWRFSWDGNDTDVPEVAEELHKIRIPEGDEKKEFSKCPTLLLCALEIAYFLERNDVCYSHGVLLLSLGDEKRSAVMRYYPLNGDPHWIYPASHLLPPKGEGTLYRWPPPALILQQSKELPRPTIFFVCLHDMGWMPWAWAERGMKRFDHVLFYTLINPRVDENGRLLRNVIPVPHWFGHFHPRNVFDEKFATFSKRPKAVFWRGATTGLPTTEVNAYWNRSSRLDNFDRPAEGLPYLEGTDRGKVVKAFHTCFNASAPHNIWSGVQIPAPKGSKALVGYEQSMFNVSFSNVVQPSISGTIPELLLDGERVSEGNWSKHGRVLLDIDGNANAWEGLRWKLGDGTGPVVKIDSSQRYVQWYYHMLEDGVHLKLVSLPQTPAETEHSERNARSKVECSWKDGGPGGGRGRGGAPADKKGIQRLRKMANELYDLVHNKNNRSLVMMENAREFYEKHLTYNASVDHLRGRIRWCWENKVNGWGDADYRIKARRGQ